jgi:hypothetical protein
VRLFLRRLKTRANDLMSVVANTPYHEPARLIGDAGRIRNGRDESADAIGLQLSDCSYGRSEMITSSSEVGRRDSVVAPSDSTQYGY